MRQFIFLFFILFGGCLSAQTLGNFEEVVYLKNGSVIRGIIVETIPNKSVKIQTHENNLMVYQFDEIEKITRELPVGGSAHSGNRKAKGFNMYIDEAVALWIVDGVTPMSLLTATAGYKINRAVFIGGGTGLFGRPGFISVPVFADLRFTLAKTRVAPLMTLQAGYMTRNLLGDNSSSYGVSTSSKGGFTFGVKPGMSINVKKDVDINLSTGYQLGSQIITTTSQSYSYYGYGSSSTNTSYGLMHMVVITAGIKF